MKIVSKICVLFLLIIAFFFVSEEPTFANSSCPERETCVAGETASKAACIVTATTNYNNCVTQYVTEPYNECIRIVTENRSYCNQQTIDQYYYDLSQHCLPLGNPGTPNYDACENEYFWRQNENFWNCIANETLETIQCDLDRLGNESFCSVQQSGEMGSCNSINHNCSSISCP